MRVVTTKFHAKGKLYKAEMSSVSRSWIRCSWYDCQREHGVDPGRKVELLKRAIDIPQRADVDDGLLNFDPQSRLRNSSKFTEKVVPRAASVGCVPLLWPEAYRDVPGTHSCHLLQQFSGRFTGMRALLATALPNWFFTHTMRSASFISQIL